MRRLRVNIFVKLETNTLLYSIKLLAKLFFKRYFGSIRFEKTAYKCFQYYPTQKLFPNTVLHQIYLLDQRYFPLKVLPFKNSFKYQIHAYSLTPLLNYAFHLIYTPSSAMCILKQLGFFTMKFIYLNESYIQKIYLYRRILHSTRKCML